MSRSPGISASVTEGVLARAENRCERCGASLYGVMYSKHHRRPRGMGGSRRSDTNLASNLIVLCGSGTDGCHGYMESHRQEALELGYILRQGENPAEEVVHLRYGKVYLRDDFSIDKTLLPFPCTIEPIHGIYKEHYERD